jgi:hypothetical protein
MRDPADHAIFALKMGINQPEISSGQLPPRGLDFSRFPPFFAKTRKNPLLRRKKRLQLLSGDHHHG